jgi:hypothetical protein
MLSKEEKSKIKERINKETLMEVTFHNSGLITAKRKFRSLSGRTSEMYAKKIEKIIPNAKVKFQQTKNDSVVVKFEVKENINGTR